MFSLAAAVLKMTFDSFVEKARSLVSNFEDIKTKPDGLVDSVSFIQEGLRLLNDSLDKPNTPPEQEDDKVGGNCNRAGSPDPDSAFKLVEAINEMNINSRDHFTSAMESFKIANTKATEAFHNESLSLEDRILAAELRVKSRLYLSLENPSLASQPCRLYLEELHGLASIVKDFRSDLEGRMFSFLDKEKRHKLVLSVSAINFVVFKFLKSFTKGPISLYDWPNLNSGGWTYNPLIPNKTICMGLRSARIEFPNLVVFRELHRRSVALTSNGDLIAGCIIKEGVVDFQKITMNEIETSALSCNHIWSCHLLLLAIDSKDNAYVLADTNCSNSGSRSIAPMACELTAFDSQNILTEKFNVGYCSHPLWNILVSTPDGFALLGYNMSIYRVVFYKNNKGKIEPTYSFDINLWEFSLITVTKKYQLVAIEKSGYRVRVYETDGQLKREFELYGGELESCVSIAFNYLTEELVFVSRVGNWYFLSTYEPETGKRRHNVRLTLFGTEEQDLRLTAHCSGPMALVSREYALYLQ
jgi:hypothetical protein